jgi:hypothetical protein
MDTEKECGYEPPSGFEEDTRDPLVDLNLTDSTELWLIQWPYKQSAQKQPFAVDFDGKEVSLNLNQDGMLGSFEDSSGKAYDVVSFASQDADASVFVPTASGSKILGKISRRVSLIHYPDPEELKRQKAENLRQMYEKSTGTSLTNSSRKTKRSNSVSARPTSTHRPKSHMPDSGGEESKSPSKKKHGDGESVDRSTQDSGLTTSPGSAGDLTERKSKKKKRKIED